VKGNSALWHVTIPANTTGWLAEDMGKYKMNGVALSENQQIKVGTREGRQGFELPAGSYTFEVQLP
jgi:hypothetical protein